MLEPILEGFVAAAQVASQVALCARSAKPGLSVQDLIRLRLLEETAVI